MNPIACLHASFSLALISTAEHPLCSAAAARADERPHASKGAPCSPRYAALTALASPSLSIAPSFLSYPLRFRSSFPFPFPLLLPSSCRVNWRIERRRRSISSIIIWQAYSIENHSTKVRTERRRRKGQRRDTGKQARTRAVRLHASERWARDRSVLSSESRSQPLSSCAPCSAVLCRVCS